MLWQLRAGLILLGGAFRATAQYRANIFSNMAAGAAFQTVGLIGLWVILNRFGEVAGWTMSDVALMYGLRLTAHAAWAVPLNQLMEIEHQVREGLIDRYLVRPVNPLVQLLTGRVRLNVFGDLAAGLILLAVAASRADVDWTPARLAFLVLAILGGGMIEGGFQLGLAAISFRTLGTSEMRFTVDTIFNLYGNYPAKIFSVPGQIALSVLPVAFVAYLPTCALLGRDSGLPLPDWAGYAAPGLGLLIATGGYLFWRSQLRNYQGAGS
ncbi:transporter [Actinorhabdospora filicis]|uniref:Transporter n=1 Tax=Actinorhabdospora filicis TaxID=1785913 RepID=A0A9W6SN72_9ACTN|nr:ABC-2 family transporter protein [Actinorhabdospora filicis]GLZ77651.1 transporter [Actinorhabdospora filicis]